MNDGRAFIVRLFIRRNRDKGGLSALAAETHIAESALLDYITGKPQALKEPQIELLNSLAAQAQQSLE